MLRSKGTMKTFPRSRGQRGFTLLETMIVVAIAAMILVLTIPQIFYLIRRGRFEGVARETASAVGKARIESIRRGVPVIVRPDYAANQVVVFADINDNAGNPGSDLLFNPQAGANAGTTDFEILRITLPQTIEFWGPGDASPEGGAAILGLTDLDGAGGEPNGAVLERDGTIRDLGAFHFGDQRGNILQVLISPASTARAQIRKYDPDRTVGLDGTHFYTRGEDDQPWRWFE